MSFDPQNAPDFWTVPIRKVIDVDGNVFVLVRDQDGIEYLVDEDDR